MLNTIINRLSDSLRSVSSKFFRQRQDSCAEPIRHISHSQFRSVLQPSDSDRLGDFRAGHPLRLIAYVRTGHDSLAEEQEKQIRDYCSKHNHRILAVLGKHGNPKTARQLAFDAMHNADGLITTDLMRLFCHDVDPVRELKQQINENFFHCSKHLIAIDNHVDATTADGQAKIINFLNELTDSARKPSEGLHNIEAVQLTARDTMYHSTDNED